MLEYKGNAKLSSWPPVSYSLVHMITGTWVTTRWQISPRRFSCSPLLWLLVKKEKIENHITNVKSWNIASISVYACSGGEAFFQTRINLQHWWITTCSSFYYNRHLWNHLETSKLIRIKSHFENPLLYGIKMTLLTLNRVFAFFSVSGVSEFFQLNFPLQSQKLNYLEFSGLIGLELSWFFM